jgi:hypothetical protein
MEPALREQLAPDAIVQVIQQIPHGDHTWTTQVKGTVVSFAQRPTGSWFAHARDDRLWLDRLVLRREDGEILTLILDAYSHVEILPQPTKPAQPQPAAP